MRKWRKNHELLIVNSGSVKKIYNYINSTIRNTHSSIKLLDNINGQLMDDKNAAEAFNAYFSLVLVHNDGNLPPFVLRDIKCKFNDDIDFSLVEKLLRH